MLDLQPAKVQCVECRWFSLRSAPKMAPLGFGNCELEPRWKYQGATREHTCSTFTPENAARAGERRGWLASQRSDMAAGGAGA